MVSRSWEGERKGESVFNEYTVPVEGDKKTLEMDVVMVAQQYECT